MAIFHSAVADDDILGRSSETPAVGVAAGFDRDAIVTGIEVAALDEHVAAGLGVAAVVVRSMRLDAHVAHRHVAGENGMDLPHRRVDDPHALDENVPAPVRLNELRAQIRSIAEDALCHRSSRFRQAEQPLARCDLVRSPSPLDILPGPPVRFARLAIECSFSGDRDVLLLEGIDEG